MKVTSLNTFQNSSFDILYSQMGSSPHFTDAKTEAQPPEAEPWGLPTSSPGPVTSVVDTKTGAEEKPLVPASRRSLDPPCHPTPPTLHHHGNYAGEPHHC